MFFVVRCQVRQNLDGDLSYLMSLNLETEGRLVSRFPCFPDTCYLFASSRSFHPLPLLFHRFLVCDII